MNYDKLYVKQLIEELEKYEEKLEKLSNSKESDSSEVESLKKEIERLEKELEEANKINVSLAKELNDANSNNAKELNKELEQENKELQKEIEDIKNNMKKPVISNTINIFEEMKNGNLVKFLKPTRNPHSKIFKENPFTFEIDGKGAIFVGELIGMYERLPKCIKYYHNQKAKQPYGGEILYQILGANDESFDCRVKIGTGYGKKLNSFTYADVLKLNPTLNIKKHMFESDKYCKYIYTDSSGSDFIIKNHEIEYI